MHASCTVCDVGFEDKEALDQVRQEVSTLRRSPQREADVTPRLVGRSTLMPVTPDSGVEPVIFPLVRQPFWMRTTENRPGILVALSASCPLRTTCH